MACSTPTILKLLQVTFGQHALVHVTAISGKLRACPSQFTSRAEAANGLSAARRRALARAPGHARVAGNRVRWAWCLVTSEGLAAKCSCAVALRAGIWETIYQSQLGSFQNTKVQHRIHNSPTMDSTPNQIQSTHFAKIHSHLGLRPNTRVSYACYKGCPSHLHSRNRPINNANDNTTP
jgi:hypothetical protein